MVKDFKIILNQPPQQGFFPGTEVSGILAFEVTEPKSYSYVKISLLGRAHVSWSESHGTGDDRRTYYYSANREYVNMQAVVWSREQAPNGMLNPSLYNFPFRFVLPNQRLPPSFGRRQGTGSIRYGVEGRIGTGVLQFDHVIEAEFPLLEAVDTNVPQFEVPGGGGITKTLCCLCCASGPITMTAEIPRIGFCIGDVIPLNVHLENGSNRQIPVSANIHQRIVYSAEGRHTYGGRQVLSLLSGPMQPRSPSVWSPGDNLKIPLVEPTLTSCDIIQVSYFLRVSAQIPRALNSSVDIPITIGNVPRQDPNQAVTTSSLPPHIGVPPVAAPLPFNPQGRPPGPAIGWVESTTGPGQEQLFSGTSAKPDSELPPPYSAAIEENTKF